MNAACAGGRGGGCRLNRKPDARAAFAALARQAEEASATHSAQRLRYTTAGAAKEASDTLYSAQRPLYTTVRKTESWLARPATW